jgi:hypothetical protein
MKSLLLSLLVLTAPAALAETRADTVGDSRFALRASLQPEPKAVSDARYRLRGAFTREMRTSPPQEAVGFALKASFAPKSTCTFPTILFKNGFEAQP